MGITTKAIQRGAMTVAAVAAVGALGACSSGQQGNPAPAPQGTVGNGVGVGTAPNAGTSHGAEAKGTPAADGSGSANAGGHPNCTNLKVTDKSPDLVPGSTTQMRFQLLLTNQGSAPCIVRGFPGVRLTGDDGTGWDLARTGAPVTPVLLGHGEHATADLTYATAAPITGTGSGSGADSGWHPTTMTVTPPNSTNTQTLAWVDGVGLAKQDGATHPGTYIGPAQPSGAK
ncbi:DUF4232 domain-containing protein [Amycolatopsis sp. NPDC059021]|uniref:DUF4232 domain-containing protein n=1 Tax=Amycolatopsis sp. NPDC059021 TaxID=3346704 RepID=UPI00366AF75C